MRPAGGLGTAHRGCGRSTTALRHGQHPCAMAGLLPPPLPRPCPGGPGTHRPPAALPGLPQQLLTTLKGGLSILSANSPCWVNKCALSNAQGDPPRSPPALRLVGVRLRCPTAQAEGRGLICTDKVGSLRFSAIKQLRSFYTPVLSGLMCLIEQEKNPIVLAGKAASALQAPPARSRGRRCLCEGEVWSPPPAPAAAGTGTQRHGRAPRAGLGTHL